MTGSQIRVGVFGAQGPNAPGYRVRVALAGRDLSRFGVMLVPQLLFTAEEGRSFGRAPALRRAHMIMSAHRRLVRSLRDLDDSVDAALVQRQVDMLPTLRLERLAARGRRMILDVDDAIWLDARPEARGHPLAFVKNSARKVRWLAENAQTVIAGNAILAEWLQQHNERVVVIPSVVDVRKIPVRRHEERRVVTWGWIGSSSTAAQLAERAGALERAARSRPDLNIELLVVGGDAPQVRGVHSRSVAWSEEAEREALSTMDIGIMPLVDSPWARGKCAYKALQYMGAGIPVVADDVGVSARVVGHDECGLIARTREEWAEALVTLSADLELRSKLGRAGRARVESDFSVTRWAPVLASVLRGEYGVSAPPVADA